LLHDQQKNCTKLAMKIGAVGFQGLKEIAVALKIY
jgi:hypothetical protein